MCIRDRSKVKELIEFVKKSGGLDYAICVMKDYQKKAKDILAEFPDSEAKHSLNLMLDYVIAVSYTHLDVYKRQAITNDGENLYIGDFGNNAGNRKDLAIYKIENSTNSYKIQFNYQNQKNFKTNYLNHDFDCEAMIFLDNKIHIFSKEWSSKNISHYIINFQNSENQTVTKIETLPIGFVVTDASYFEGKLYVCLLYTSRCV